MDIIGSSFVASSPLGYRGFACLWGCGCVQGATLRSSRLARAPFRRSARARSRSRCPARARSWPRCPARGSRAWFTPAVSLTGASRARGAVSSSVGNFAKGQGAPFPRMSDNVHYVKCDLSRPIIQVLALGAPCPDADARTWVILGAPEIRASPNRCRPPEWWSWRLRNFAPHTREPSSHQNLGCGHA